MKKLIFLCTLSLTLLSSCFYAFYPQTSGNTYGVTNPDNIRIYSGNIEQEYAIIGSVAADACGNAYAALKHLKKKASGLGADAIIHASLIKASPSSMRTGISGVAVKLTENISKNSEGTIIFN